MLLPRILSLFTFVFLLVMNLLNTIPKLRANFVLLFSITVSEGLMEKQRSVTYTKNLDLRIVKSASSRSFLSTGRNMFGA